MSVNSTNSQFHIALPPWAIQANRDLPECLPDIEDRMQTVIEFSRQNFMRQTGGPFAAGVFERDTGRVVVIGVNRVIPSRVSSAHAEIVALSLAQQIVGNFDLGADAAVSYQLVVNARPCAMCFGALPWSGIVSLVVGAAGGHIEALTGFDEGPIHPQWQLELRNRGIDVVENVLEKKACEVLAAFGKSDQVVYNGRAAQQ